MMKKRVVTALTDDQIITCEVHRMRQRLYLAGIPREDAAQAARLALLRADTPHRTTVIRRAIIDEIDRWTGRWRTGAGGRKQGLPLDGVPEPATVPEWDATLDAAIQRRRVHEWTQTLPAEERVVIQSCLAGQSVPTISVQTGHSEQMVWYYRRRALRTLRTMACRQ